MTEEELNKLFKSKLDFLEGREKNLNKRVKGLERQLFQLILKQVIDKVDVKNGVILQNKKNLKLTASIQALFKKFNAGANAKNISQFITDIESSMGLSNNYYSGFTTKAKFDAIGKRSKGIVLGRLGVDGKGKLISGGMMDSFLQDSTVRTEVTQATVKNITAGNPVSVLRQELSTIIKGVPDGVEGKLARHYKTFVNDAYQEVDRTYNTLIAKDLKLQAFRYSGGKIKTTRNFCCQRNGLIFTEKEAEQWKKLKWGGKPKTGYNPITQMGGYNCRHNVQWLPNEMVLRRRPDLMEKNGKLVKRPKAKPQKLHKCKPD